MSPFTINEKEVIVRFEEGETRTLPVTVKLGRLMFVAGKGIKKGIVGLHTGQDEDILEEKERKKMD